MTELWGCGTALVTPFRPSGEVDFESYRRLIRWQIESGVHFLVPAGTTGESVTLKEAEYRRVIRTCVEEAAGQVPVVAGAGTNDTEHAVHLARLAESEGATVLLSVTPYYNRPTPEGLYRHFREIARAVKLPILVYNVPGRTGGNVDPETLVRLAGIENVVGVKEASGNLLQIMDILATRRPDFAVLSGDDSLTLALMALGGDGVISVASNVIPAEVSRMAEKAREGNFEEARALHFRYLKLVNLLFIESNPIPVKYALARMGRVEEVYRLPLCPLTEASRKKVEEELERLCLVRAHA